MRQTMYNWVDGYNASKKYSNMYTYLIHIISDIKNIDTSVVRYASYIIPSIHLFLVHSQN